MTMTDAAIFNLRTIAIFFFIVVQLSGVVA